MTQPKINLELVRQRYLAWLDAEERSFNAHRQSFVESLAWIKADSIVDADHVLPVWQRQRPAASRPRTYRLLGELAQAGVLVKAPGAAAMTFQAHADCFDLRKDSDAS